MRGRPGILGPLAAAAVLLASLQAATASGQALNGDPLTDRGYLRPDEIDASALLGPPPAPGSPRGIADWARFIETRSLEGSERWRVASLDVDIRSGAFARFSCAAGVTKAASRACAVLVLAPFSKAFSTGIWLRTISKKASLIESVPPGRLANCCHTAAKARAVGVDSRTSAALKGRVARPSIHAWGPVVLALASGLGTASTTGVVAKDAPGWSAASRHWSCGGRCRGPPRPRRRRSRAAG